MDTALQQRMSQEATPSKGRDPLRTSIKVSPVGEHLSFQARGGEEVRFAYELGQWRAEVSSRIGAFSRRAVLPVVCSSGEDAASSIAALSKYPSCHSQRQIHVLAGNVSPILEEVVYLGALGLKGGGGGEASGSGEQQESDSPFVKELRALVSDLQVQETPEKLAELGEVLRKLAKSKHEAGASAKDLSCYTDAAILYQHVLSICKKHKQ